MPANVSAPSRLTTVNEMTSPEIPVMRAQWLSLEDQKGEPREHERQKERRTAHRCDQEPFEQLASSHIGDGEANSPHAGSHEIHADQAWEQEVDVP